MSQPRTRSTSLQFPVFEFHFRLTSFIALWYRTDNFKGARQVGHQGAYAKSDTKRVKYKCKTLESSKNAALVVGLQTCTARLKLSREHSESGIVSLASSTVSSHLWPLVTPIADLWRHQRYSFVDAAA